MFKSLLQSQSLTLNHSTYVYAPIEKMQKHANFR